MVHRIALVTTWFLTGWMCAAMAAFVLGLPTWIAPLLAVAAAAYVGYWSGSREPGKSSAAPGQPVATAPSQN